MTWKLLTAEQNCALIFTGSIMRDKLLKQSKCRDKVRDKLLKQNRYRDKTRDERLKQNRCRDKVRDKLLKKIYRKNF